ncbi:Ankyrin repeat protein [Dorcoceras hygrometricum]|uniref:Ankyrin repeat protein n=1 Tax=Dorcoceras hygrometricum TaxID=472368 RepID=A0A2Z7BTB0_9LAMI|nr:Ankyrin repeat protein [Dorcoceras hygrometricum]
MFEEFTKELKFLLNSNVALNFGKWQQQVTVARAGEFGISRYGDISVTHEDLLALVRIEVAAGRHRA